MFNCQLSLLSLLAFRNFTKTYIANTTPADCQNTTTAGSDYGGCASLTRSGRRCQAWSSQSPHKPIRHTRLESNFCRNPDKQSGVWCYTRDAGQRWELCDVPKCVISTNTTTTPPTPTLTSEIDWVIDMDPADVCVAPGTSVTFKFTSGHNVVEVASSQELEDCSFNDFDSISGPYIWPGSSSPGSHFFVCGVGDHCNRGMKASVSVSDTCEPTTTSSTISSTTLSTTSTETPIGRLWVCSDRIRCLTS